MRCVVAAPVDYVARDFVLHLFAVFCRAVVRRYFFFQAEDGIRFLTVTGVQTCALPISPRPGWPPNRAGKPWAAKPGKSRRSRPWTSRAGGPSPGPNVRTSRLLKRCRG